MELTKKIFAVLKPKVGAFGFNRKELMGVAEGIANNLKLEDDASEEDINAAVDEAVEAVVPMLKIGQAMATRVINKAKASQQTDEHDDDDDDDDDDKSQKASKSKPTKAKEDETIPALVADLKKSVEALSGQVETLKGEKVADTRRGRLKELLKDAGTFGTRTLKNFDKMSFEDDDAFEDFLSDVEADLKALNQERADAGLSHLGTPPAGGHKPDNQKPELVTDEQLKAMAGSY